MPAHATILSVCCIVAKMSVSMNQSLPLGPALGCHTHNLQVLTNRRPGSGLVTLMGARRQNQKSPGNCSKVRHLFRYDTARKESIIRETGHCKTKTPIQMLSFDSKQNLVDFPTLKKDKKNKRFLLLWLKSLKSAANLDDEHNHKI